MKILKTLAASAAIATVAAAASAHTIGIGWLDNGNGTVTLYSEHWHGNLTSPYSDNGGLGVYDGSGNFLYKTQWTTVLNDADLNGDGDASGSSTTPYSLTGYGADPDNHSSYPVGTDDWLISDPLVLGNGTWGFFTGKGCCVDTMTDILYFQVTGITSVDPGTGPGAPGSNNGDPSAYIPVPAGLPLLIGGLGALGWISRRRKAA